MNGTFDPIKHEYKLNGIVVPSVTQTIKAAGYINDAFFRPEHAQRGSYVHEACELYDREQLDFNSLDDALKGYVDAWMEFRRLMPVTFTVIEGVFWSEEHGFVGRMDRAWADTVCDIKTGNFPKWLPLQLGAYSILCPASFACGVQLKPNGKFSMKNIAPYELSLARKEFLAALEKVKHGTQSQD